MVPHVQDMNMKVSDDSTMTMSTSTATATTSPSATPRLKPSVVPATTKSWNTKNLGWRVAGDATSAACAGALVAPIISIIDRSIMENASGRDTLLSSIRSSIRNLLVNPRSALFSRPCALIFLLYGGTYLTANSLDTATSTVTNRPASTVSSGASKFVASSAANVGLCMYKDRAFVRMFGPVGAVPRAVPGTSYALFTLRDCMTIFASFNIPPLLAPYIDARMSAEVKKRLSGLTTAQFLAPAAVQFISTPLHLLGLDLYNRPAGQQQHGSISWRERLATVRSNWFISAVARIGRIVPAFGVGGVVNFKVRRSLMTKLE